MSISYVFSFFQSILRRRNSRAIGIRAALVSCFLLVLGGCASGMGVVKTWNGNPAGASEAATLKAPGEIEVTQVNGQAMSNFLMEDLALDYALLPGENEVVFVYKTIWAKSGVVRNGESKVHVIESAPQVARFEAQPGETYTFEFDAPESRQEAERVMPEFSADIVTSGGQAVASSSTWDPAQSMVASRTPLPESQPSRQSQTRASVQADNTPALDQLKAIWQTASDEEKKAFLRWAFE